MTQGRVCQNRRKVESAGDFQLAAGKGELDKIDDMAAFVVSHLVYHRHTDISPLLFEKSHVETEGINNAAYAAPCDDNNWSLKYIGYFCVVQTNNRADSGMTCTLNNQKIVSLLQLSDC